MNYGARLQMALGAAEEAWTSFPRPRLYLLLGLWGGFIASMLFRFWYVFYNGPFNHLFSDANRHWLNGQRYLNPDMMGSIDPLVYQIWLFVLSKIDDGTHFTVLAATGLLSASLPFFWYKAAREVVPLAWALAAGVMIGFMPSLLTIYSYFMNETLAMPLMAAGLWLTLRAMRRKDTASVIAMAFVWAIACYTRITALPVAGLAAAILFYALPWKGRVLLAAAVVAAFSLLAVPACEHSRKNLNFCELFGSGYLNKVYRASGAATTEMNILTKGRWGFSSPSIYTQPMHPLSTWKSPREGTHRFEIDPAYGRRDWDAAFEDAQMYGMRPSMMADFSENAVKLFFDESWPDDNPEYWWGRLNIWNRWIWLPLTLAVALWFAEVKPGLRTGMIPLSGLLLMVLLMGQTSGIMEGRYRKPAEPLLLVGALVLIQRLKAAGTPIIRLSW